MQSRQLLRLLGDLRNSLDRGRPSAYHGNALGGEIDATLWPLAGVGPLTSKRFEAPAENADT